jgi:hypothetical protein
MSIEQMFAQTTNQHALGRMYPFGASACARSVGQDVCFRLHCACLLNDKPALREQTGRELLDDPESVAYRRSGSIGDTLNMKKERKELEIT